MFVQYFITIHSEARIPKVSKLVRLHTVDISCIYPMYSQYKHYILTDVDSLLQVKWIISAHRTSGGTSLLLSHSTTGTTPASSTSSTE